MQSWRQITSFLAYLCIVLCFISIRIRYVYNLISKLDGAMPPYECTTILK
jgi:hypothetical protein